MRQKMKNNNQDKVTILTEGTPNPNAIKFVLNKSILENKTANFPSREKADNSPLAKKLFGIKEVREVFIGKDFITVSKDTNTPWEIIYDKVQEIITKHIESGEEVLIEKTNDGKKRSSSEIENKILELLDSRIRPAVASDGGDVLFESYEDGILRLHLQGACSHCPSSIMTLKSGIEALLKREIPELKEVISV